jgi:hypothetical protein
VSSSEVNRDDGDRLASSSSIADRNRSGRARTSRPPAAGRKFNPLILSEIQVLLPGLCSVLLTVQFAVAAFSDVGSLNMILRFFVTAELNGLGASFRVPWTLFSSRWLFGRATECEGR